MTNTTGTSTGTTGTVKPQSGFNSNPSDQSKTGFAGAQDAEAGIQADRSPNSTPPEVREKTIPGDREKEWVKPPMDDKAKQSPTSKI